MDRFRHDWYPSHTSGNGAVLLLLCLTDYWRNLDDFEARSPDELSLSKGDRLELIERDDDFGDGWYLGKHLQNGRSGLFPEGWLKSKHDKLSTGTF